MDALQLNTDAFEAGSVPLCLFAALFNIYKYLIFIDNMWRFMCSASYSVFSVWQCWSAGVSPAARRQEDGASPVRYNPTYPLFDLVPLCSRASSLSVHVVSGATADGNSCQRKLHLHSLFLPFCVLKQREHKASHCVLMDNPASSSSPCVSFVRQLLMVHKERGAMC